MMVPSPYIMARGTDYITAAVFTNPCLGERREGGRSLCTVYVT